MTFEEKTLSSEMIYEGAILNLRKDKVEVINYKFHCNISNILNKKLIARPRFSSKGLKGELKLIKNSEKNSVFTGRRRNRIVDKI